MCSFSNIKPNHFVWIFGVNNNDESISIHDNSRVFDLNTMPSFVESRIITPVPIPLIFGVRYSVIQAVIVSIRIDIIAVHKQCNSIVNKEKICIDCNINVDNCTQESLGVSMIVDDGMGQLDICASYETFKIFGCTLEEWKDLHMTFSDIINNQVFLFRQKTKIEREHYQELEEKLQKLSLKLESIKKRAIQLNIEITPDDMEEYLRIEREKLGLNRIPEIPDENDLMEEIMNESKTLYDKNQSRIKDLVNRFLGKEFIFNVSKINSNDSWRLDYISLGSGEAKRKVGVLEEQLNNNSFSALSCIGISSFQKIKTC